MGIQSWLRKNVRNLQNKVDLNERFTFHGTIGPGSMSKVWRVTDKVSKRRRALKVLDMGKTQQFEERFKNVEKPSEAEIALELKHPYIVQTIEVGVSHEGRQFLLMEYIDGRPLSYLIDLQNDQMKSYCLQYMIQLGQAVQHINESGWIHHDLCPRNIMVSNKDNKIKVIDFGLTVPNTPEFHQPGNRTGTAQYMAPELIKRQKIDQRIDVFAYAMTCYEMITGRLPWESNNTQESVMQYLNSEPLDIRELKPKLDPQIASTVMIGVSPNPIARFAKAGDMVAQLTEAFRRLKAKNSP